MTAQVVVRDAAIDDAEAIARVHTSAWQAGYAGQLPAEHLDRLTSTIGERAERWRSVLSTALEHVLVASFAGGELPHLAGPRMTGFPWPAGVSTLHGHAPPTDQVYIVLSGAQDRQSKSTPSELARSCSTNAYASAHCSGANRCVTRPAIGKRPFETSRKNSLRTWCSRSPRT